MTGARWFQEPPQTFQCPRCGRWYCGEHACKPKVERRFIPDETGERDKRQEELWEVTVRVGNVAYRIRRTITEAMRHLTDEALRWMEGECRAQFRKQGYKLRD